MYRCEFRGLNSFYIKVEVLSIRMAKVQDKNRFYAWALIGNEPITGKVGSLRPTYALGASSFFKKYKRKNLEFFTRRRESDFGNL